MGAALVLFAIALVVGLFWSKPSKSKLPPGPRGLPVVGNIHQISRRYSWKQFQEWHKIYGPVISLRLGQLTFILLGNYEVTKELLDRRSGVYSSRPPLAVAGECLGKGFGAALLPYGPRWRQFRKIQMSLLNSRRCRLYSPLQELESRHLLYNLLSTDDFEPELYRCSSSLIFTLLYGRRFQTGQETDLKQTEHLATSALQAVSFGNWLVDIFPVLNKLPRFLAKWKRVGDDFHNRRAELYGRNAANALGLPCWNWTKQSVLHDAHEASHKELVFLLGEIYETASHTTAGALVVAILACVSYPAVVRRVQDELDEQVGPDRLPGLSDMSNLPYTQAFVQEVLRWRPLAPGGIPHSPIRDDNYRGFVIPKGAIVNASHWCLEMDDEIFHSPEEFIPERWMENDGLPTAGFGFGRRTCPGQHLARNTMLLIVSRLIWAFDMKWKQGQEADIDALEMTHEGIFSKPCSFEATFTARSPGHQRVVRREWEGRDDDVGEMLDKIGKGFDVK
ncbi:hypothetical protein G6O67_006599 [Ophiocordyceps sinensis]|uniref:Cytochrome P450 n=1 Tax=Ophiocordyceps sinensis TaxID=72228 RepID=A0A8H4LX33_9HYPO|nr:hypothetical protein G6O67_006599 [Ophiocordyceps sinensis]